MNHRIKNILQNTSRAARLMLGISKKYDYRALSRYMLRITEMQDLDNILREAAQCLKDILSYQLFGFAIQEDGQLDVWIDPSIYKDPFGKIIESDFGARSTYTLHHFKEDSDPDTRLVTFHSTDLISYVLMDGHYFAKLYILPHRRILFYHSEIINTIVKTLGIALAHYMSIKTLKNAAAFDPMTNCYNRREFERLIEHNIANAVRYGRDLSIVMLDLDHFKAVNDRYGHMAGDQVLRSVAEAIQSQIRKGDYLCRYGGEEFVLVLPDTKRPRAMELAERLKNVIRSLRIPAADGEAVKITASFGVASLRRNSDREGLLNEADAMLYQAKAGGRDRVMPQMKLLRTPLKNDSQTL